VTSPHGHDFAAYAGWHRRSDRRLRKGKRLHRVGAYYAVRHRLAEAEEFERLAVETLSHASPGVARNQLLAEALAGFGQVARLRGHYSEAESALKQALTLLPASRAGGAVRIGALAGLGIVCKETGRFNEADQMYRRVGQEIKQTADTDVGWMANLLHNQAGLAHARGEYTTGESLARQAVAIRVEALGPDHVLVAQDESVLAANLAGLQRYDDAEALYRRVLDRFKRQSPKDTYEIAVNLHGLAAVLAAQGAPAKAEKLYRRALSMKKKLLGADHAEVALVLNNLGALLRDVGRHAEAEACYNQCVPVLDTALGPQHPTAVVARRNREKNQAATG
jgi:tetratricopeptide (TPR) repeat protein